MIPKEFLRSSYCYDLPEELIASEPIKVRSDSRLLVVNRTQKTIQHSVFSKLPVILKDFFGEKTVHIVANNTRVMKARMLGKRINQRITGAESHLGGKVEFFVLAREPNAESGSRFQFRGLMKSSAQINPGFDFLLFKNNSPLQARGKVISKTADSAGIQYVAEFDRDLLLEEFGETPLPPYILAKRKKENPNFNLEKGSFDEDTMYNTEYASRSLDLMKSVAAPTAGRHFTLSLISELKNLDYTWDEISLHVGIGTFKPVETDDIRDHSLHSETVSIDRETAKQIEKYILKKEPILAVGTTSVRALEGSWEGKNGKGSTLFRDGMHDVNLFLHPGGTKHFQVVDAMITNFHLPESTLLMMVAHFIGDLDWTLKIYKDAIDNKYRFYSYGDAMLIL